MLEKTEFGVTTIGYFEKPRKTH